MKPYPTAINLRTRSRVLHIEFDDGAGFDLPCEYLRVCCGSLGVSADPCHVVGI